MYNIYKTFIEISMSVKLAEISVHYKQMHKFTSLPINLTPETHVPFPQQAVSTHSKTQNSINSDAKHHDRLIHQSDNVNTQNQTDSTDFSSSE